MLKFKNLRWLFRKNTTVSIVLMLVAIGFSFYINYESISSRLSSNNQLVSSYIQGQFNQFKTRLELARQMLKFASINEVHLGEFTSVYYLDESGNVLKRISRDDNDQIKRFIQINSNTLKDGIFASRLVYSKTMRPSIYLATKLDEKGVENAKNIDGVDAAFLCVRVEITQFLKGVVTFKAGYLITDSHENILYSSQPGVVPAGINIGSMSNIFSFRGLVAENSALVASVQKLDAGFYVRSFIGKDELINNYFLISLLLICVCITCFYSFYLDRKALKVGLIDQINYCVKLLRSEKIYENQHVTALAHNDIIELQRLVAKNIGELCCIREDYKEIEQRLNSMFSKSYIPMLMIDAFTAQIHKANQAALEFYDQKAAAIAKMNLYMLARKDNKALNDPMVLASNMQNSISNQGAYIKAHHYAGGRHKEVKIYSFVMSSENFRYDTLMVLDNDALSRQFASLSLRDKALEYSSICTMDLALENNHLIVKKASKGLNRLLHNVTLIDRQLRSLVHESSIASLAALQKKIRSLKSSNNIEQYVLHECSLYMRQSDGNYSEFKASFVVSYTTDSEELCINISALLARTRSDLGSFEVVNDVDYQHIYQNAKELIAICDEDFEFLSYNAALRDLIGPNARNLQDVLSDSTKGVLERMKQGINRDSLVELIDHAGIEHGCKFKYIISKAAQNKLIYCVYFQEDFYQPLLPKFAKFMAERDVNIEPHLAEFYTQVHMNSFIARASLDELENTQGLRVLKDIYQQTLTNTIRSKNEQS